jgi:hypothetical protein
VHKRSVENVLVTEIKACGEDRFICAGHVPAAHRFFNDPARTPQRDILFYAELGRQCSIAISHAFLGVDRDDVFIFEGSTASLTEAVWRSLVAPSAESVIVEVRLREIARRRNVVSRVAGEYTMLAGGDVVFTATGAWSLQARALFDRLRRGTVKRLSDSRPAAVRAGQSNDPRLRSARHDNVVIDPPAYAEAASEFTTQLLVDERHPFFFDHPCDHVPGVLLLEGCAQLTTASLAQLSAVDLARLSICDYSVNFAQFVERDLPTTLTARVSSEPATVPGILPLVTTVTISQQDVVSGTAMMRVGLSD